MEFSSISFYRLLIINHCEMSDRMLFNSGLNCSKLIPVTKGVVSCVQLEKFTSLFTIKRSQIYIMNRRGPRIDLCETLSIILNNSLNDEPTLVVCVRFFRYEIIHFNEVSLKLQAFSLPFSQPQAFTFSGSHSFQLKLFPVRETIPFSGSCSFQSELFLLVEAIPFSGSHSFQQKPFLSVEEIHFNGNHCPQWKSFLLV